MFLDLAHTKLDVYRYAKKLNVECHKVVTGFPVIERYNLVQQIMRASLSVHLNIAEGSSRRSIAERKRFYEIARGSLVEIDAALDIAELAGYCSKYEIGELGDVITKSFKLLSGLINSLHS